MPDQITDQVSTLLRMLRTMEERHNTVRKKLRLTDQTLLNSKKQVSKELLAISSEVAEVRQSLETMKYRLSLLQKQLTQTASKQDVDVISKYIEFWQPVNFITKQEAKKLLIR